MKASTVSTEQIDGAATYHVVATVDTARVMADVAKLLSSPSLPRRPARQRPLGLPGSAELKYLEKSFTSGSAEWWVDASTFALRRGKVDETFKFGSGASTQGVTGFTVGMNYTLSRLNEPVTVVPPVHALAAQEARRAVCRCSPRPSGGGRAAPASA